MSNVIYFLIKKCGNSMKSHIITKKWTKIDKILFNLSIKLLGDRKKWDRIVYFF